MANLSNVGQTARLLAACGLGHLDGDRPGEATLTDGTVVVVLSPDGDGIRSVDLHAADTEGLSTVLDGLRIQPFADE